MRFYRPQGITSPISAEDILLSRTNARLSDDPDNLEGDLIEQFVSAAHERAEQETGLIFGEGEWVIEGSPYGDLTLPVWPVISVDSITAGGDLFTEYTSSTHNRSFILKSQSWPDFVTIRVQAGMPMPPTVRQAIIMMAAWWYDMRDTASAERMQEVPYGATALLGLNRRIFA